MKQIYSKDGKNLWVGENSDLDNTDLIKLLNGDESEPAQPSAENEEFLEELKRM